jgi:hypothetical protein
VVNAVSTVRARVVPTLVKACILAAALAAPLLAACIDDHEAEDCVFIGSCPPDGGDAGDASDASDH